MPIARRRVLLTLALTPLLSLASLRARAEAPLRVVATFSIAVT